MNRRGIILITAMALLLSGCGNSAGKSALKVKMEDGDILLGTYKGIEVDKVIYKVTDQQVDEEIQSMLEEYVDYQVVDRAAAKGDYVGFDLVSTSEGKKIKDYCGEGYGAYVGQEDFGSEFDKQLLGVEAGDVKKFTVTYGEDEAEDAFAGKTVDFEMTVTSVEVEVYPELTEEVVNSEFGYKNEQELRESVAQELKEESENNANVTMQETLLHKVLDACTFKNYSEELYKLCERNMESEYMGYAEWFGCDTVEEVYDAFGMTEEDVKEEILQQVHTRMVVDAIVKAEKMELTEREYEEALPALAESMGYEDVAGVTGDYEEEELRYMILQDKVMNLIVENAIITESETEQLEESMTEDMDVEIK